MKSFFSRLSLTLCAVLLVSCAETNVSHIPQVDLVPESFAFQGGYTQVWRAAVQALASLSIVKTTDEQAGLAVTEYGTVDKVELDIVKIGFGAKTYKYSYTLNILPEVEQTRVKVRVNLLASQIGFLQREERVPQVENYLRQKLFHKICTILTNGDTASCNVTFQPIAMSSPPVSTGQAEPVASSPEPRRQKVPDPAIKEVQQRLTEQGYDPGVADGLMGRKTRAALRSFQADHQLSQTGKPDDQTRAALDLGSSGTGTAPATLPVVDENPPGRDPNIPEIDDSGFITGPPLDEPNKAPASLPAAPVVETPQPAPNPAAATVSATDAAKDAGQTAPPPPATPASHGIVTESTSLMTNASALADSLGSIPPGTPVDILGEEGNFYKVRYEGQEGFVYASYVKMK